MKIAGGLVGRSLFAIALSVAVSLGAATEALAQGADGGTFDGALWKFTMTPNAPGPKPLNGHFRVENHVLFQKESREAKGFRKVVGKNHPTGGKTRAEFTDFRAFDEAGNLYPHMKGTAILTFDKFGHWSGTLIDGGGRHWDFKCVRIQE